MRCPKSRFPIRIIVFDEHELIIFVSQGLTLSTASLVELLILQSKFELAYLSGMKNVWSKSEDYGLSMCIFLSYKF